MRVNQLVICVSCFNVSHLEGFTIVCVTFLFSILQEPIDVKANTELINLLLRHQNSAMNRDFPFHLCVSYRISKCKRRYVRK